MNFGRVASSATAPPPPPSSSSSPSNRTSAGPGGMAGNPYKSGGHVAMVDDKLRVEAAVLGIEDEKLLSCRQDDLQSGNAASILDDLADIFGSSGPSTPQSPGLAAVTSSSSSVINFDSVTESEKSSAVMGKATTSSPQASTFLTKTKEASIPSAMTSASSSASTPAEETIKPPIPQLDSDVCLEIFNESVDGFSFFVDGEGNCRHPSGADAILGIGSNEEIEDCSVFRIIHPDDHQTFSRRLMQDQECSSKAISRLWGPGQDPRQKERLFFCRFRRKPIVSVEKQVGEQFESLQVSVQTMNPSHWKKNIRMFQGKDLSNCRLFCLARKVSLNERSQHFPVDMFTTKLDLSFTVTLVDTSGLKADIASNIEKATLNFNILSLCHPEDKQILETHLKKTLDEGSDISSIYRLRILNFCPQVRTKSRHFQNCTDQPSFIMSTHSIVKGGVTTFSPSSIKSKAANSINNNNNLIKSSKGSLGSGLVKDEEIRNQIQEKNILLKQLLNLNSNRKDSGTDRKNVTSNGALQMQIASVSGNKSSAISDILSKNETESTNSRILQLLRQTENVPRGSPSPIKRTASEADLDSDSSSKASSVCKQNPALVTLLSKPPHSSVAVPPPVPTKWHQEPHEKLPRKEDSLRKFFPPHPAERAAAPVSSSSPKGPSSASFVPSQLNSSSEASISSINSSSKTSFSASNSLLTPAASSLPPVQLSNSQPSTTSEMTGRLPVVSTSSSTMEEPFDLDDLSESDPLLSEILESVIDFQCEKTELELNEGKSAAAASMIRQLSLPVSLSSSSSKTEIEHIEKFLASSENSLPSSGRYNSVSGSVGALSNSVSSMAMSSTAHSRHMSGPSSSSIQTVAGLPTGLSVVPVASGVNNTNQSASLSTLSPNTRISPTSIGGTPHQLQRRNSNPVSNANVIGQSSNNPSGNLAPRMNELLGVVPPNVSIPDCPDMDSLVMLQQRRRSSSGGHVHQRGTSLQHQMLSPHHVQQSLHQQPRGTQRNRVPSSPASAPVSSGSNNLLMQQLSSAPLNYQPMSYGYQQQPQTVSYRPQQQPMLVGHRQPQPLIQVDHLQQHQQQQNMRMKSSQPLRYPSSLASSSSTARPTEGRSLLQQLLSE